MYRRPLLIAIAVAALSAMGTFSSVSLASTSSVGGNPSHRSAVPSGVQPLAKFAHATSVKFEAEYSDALVGPVHCVGHHQTNERLGYPGTETEGGRDVERCRSTTKKVPLTFVAAGESGGYTSSSADENNSFETREGAICEYNHFEGWNSDFAGLGGKRATKFSYTVAPNGKSYKLVAYYPFG
jgi:hypothetical protein